MYVSPAPSPLERSHHARVSSPAPPMQLTDTSLPSLPRAGLQGCTESDLRVTTAAATTAATTNGGGGMGVMA